MQLSTWSSGRKELIFSDLKISNISLYCQCEIKSPAKQNSSSQLEIIMHTIKALKYRSDIRHGCGTHTWRQNTPQNKQNIKQKQINIFKGK